jgi:hypothetical protein
LQIFTAATIPPPRKLGTSLYTREALKGVNLHILQNFRRVYNPSVS